MLLIYQISNEFNCEFIYFDVLDFDNLKSVILKYKIEIIYNLAAILSAKGEKDPNKTWNLNTKSLNVANASIELGIKIFWPSSIAVFGLNSDLEFVKNDVQCFINNVRYFKACLWKTNVL